MNQIEQKDRDQSMQRVVGSAAIGAELAELGTDAASAHPVSGPRPEPDVWFGQFAEEMRKTAEAKREMQEFEKLQNNSAQPQASGQPNSQH